MPFLGCVLMVASRSTHIASESHRLFSCVRLQYELADAGQTYRVNVTVTSVDARNVKFDIKVDDQPKPRYDPVSTTTRRGLLGGEPLQPDLNASRARTHR